MSEETTKKVELVFREMELTKLNLTDGDTLAVVIRSDEITEEHIDSLKNKLTKQFPANKVLLFGLNLSDNIQFSVITQESNKEENKKLSSCATANYCINCNCGKKEAQKS